MVVWKGTKLGSGIVNGDDSQSWPTHYSVLGAGGAQELADIPSRDAIPVEAFLHPDGLGSGRRRNMMFVSVSDKGDDSPASYQLQITGYNDLSDADKLTALADNTNFVEIEFSAGGFVTLNGVQTLTNKTLINPKINIAVGSSEVDQTGDIYYRDSSGNFQRLGIGTAGQALFSTGTLPVWHDTKTDNVLYVSVSKGNDSLAIKGNQFWAYQTIGAAMLAASSGDVIHVFPGLYDEDSIPTKTNVRVHLEDGVRIAPTSSGGIVPVFSDLVAGATPSGATNFRITGYGEIINLGQSGNDTSAICSSFPASKYYIECKELSSFEAWNGGQLYLKNALLNMQFSVYLSGVAVLENCSLINYGSTNTLLTYGNPSAPGKISFINCYFEKNAVNTAFVGAPTTQGFGFDGPELLYIYADGVGGSINYIFDKCSFVQLRTGYNCIIVQSSTYNTSYNSTLQFNDCKFFNIDPTKKSIIYTTDQYAPTASLPSGFATPATVGDENGHLKFFFNNNISNVDIDNVNVTPDYEVTNEFEGVVPMLVDPNFIIIPKLY